MEIAVCPPFTALHSVSSLLQGSNIGLGAQNMHFVKEGAYTGEVSLEMLKDVRCKYVIIGIPSEDSISVRLTRCEQSPRLLFPTVYTIICVGETLEQREQGMTEDLVSRQVRMALDGIGCESIPEIIIAYEPIWAIGTGRSATAEDAEHVISLIRDVVSDMFNKEAADKMRIQYGGSVNRKT